MYYYAFTLRKSLMPAFISFYEKQLARWHTLFPLAQIDYRYESTSGLHLHGMIKTPKKIYITNSGIHPGKGWSLDFSLVLNIQTWINYMNKQSSSETTLINTEHALEYEYYLDSKKSMSAERSGPLDRTLQDNDGCHIEKDTIDTERQANRKLMKYLKTHRIV